MGPTREPRQKRPEPAVLANLDRLLIDFDAWCLHVENGHDDERRVLRREVERAETDCRRAGQAVDRTEARWQHYESTGDSVRAEAVDMLLKARNTKETAQRRLTAAHDALDSVPETAPMDGMLDFYNALRAAVRGRMEGADSVLRVNDALRDLFEHFVLNTSEDNVTVLPTLSAAATQRILLDTGLWATHADVIIDGRRATAIESDAGQAFKV